MSPSICLLILVSLRALLVASLHSLTPYEAAAMGGIPTCCPESPFLYCDFYFDGFGHDLPVFRLKDNLNGDHPLTPYASKSLKWIGFLGRFSPGVKYGKTDTLVYVKSSWKNGTFLGCSYDVNEGEQPGNQFYITGLTDDNGYGKLFARTFQRATPTQHGKEFYEKRCVYLPLTSISVPIPGGNVQLEIEDKNEIYPESRRCVVFKTGH